MSGVQQFTVCGSAGTHCFFNYLFICPRPGSRALIRCGMWEFHQPIPPVTRWQLTHIHKMNREFCFLWCYLVDSFKLLTQSIVVLSRSFSFNNWYKLPYIVFLNVLFSNTCVFAGTKDCSKGGNYTMFKAVLKKGREGGGRAGKREAGTVCLFMARRKESINKPIADTY